MITVSLVVFYSFGWRFDWNSKKITQPGIFYFKVLPKNVQIYLNGKLKKKTDFFFGSALIEDILPNKYKVEIKKDGFYPWEKELEIKKRQVTEAKSIVLVPKNLKFSKLSENTENIFFSPNKKKIILEETNSNVSDNFKKTTDKNSVPQGKSGQELKTADKNWALKLFDVEKNLTIQLIGEKDISKNKEVRLIDLKFSPNSKIILLKTGLKSPLNENKEIIRYYLLEIDKTPASLTSLGFLDKNTEEIYFNPQDPKKMFVLSLETPEANPLSLRKATGEIKKEDGVEEKIKKELREIDTVKEKISDPLLKDIIACQIINDNIYYLDKSGFLYKSSLDLKNKNKLNIVPLDLKNGENYQIKTNNSYLFLKEGRVLYLLSKDKSFQKISESVNGFKFSYDLKKLVYFNKHEIWILFLEKKYNQPQKEKGEKLFLTRFSKDIGDLFWDTDAYLIFNIENKIKIAEIDDRDKINIVELPNSYKTTMIKDSSNSFSEKFKIFWNQENNKLYVLNKNGLFFSGIISP